MAGSKTKTLALAIAFVVVASTVPLGTVAAADPQVPSTSPEVVADAQTPITPGETTDIAVAYNVTDEIDLSDLRISVTDPAAQNPMVAQNDTPNTVADSFTFTIADGEFNTGAKRVSVLAENTSPSSGPPAYQQLTLESGGNVTVDSYTVSKTTVDPDEQFWVNATLTNTGSVDETFDARVYGNSFAVTPMNNTTVTLTGGETATVNLTVSYDSTYAGLTQELTVNNESTTTVQINDDGSGGSSGSGTASNVTVSDQTTTTGSTVDVTVQYNVTNSVALSDANLTLRGPNGVIAHNNSLTTLDGSATFTVPAKDAAGEYRVRAAVIDDSMQYASLNPIAEDLFTVNVTNDVTLDSYTVDADPLFKGRSYPVNVTLNNTGGTAQNYTVHVYGQPGDYEPLNSSTFEVQPNSERTVNVMVSYSYSYTAGTYQPAVGNKTPVSVTVKDLATVADWSVVSGPTTQKSVSTPIAPPSSDGGLLQFDLMDYQQSRPQNLSATGLTNESRIKVTLHVNHTYEPGILIATAQNASMNVTNKSTYYEVNITANPLESQYTDNATSVSDWETLPENQDKASRAYKPMFSLAFVSNDSVQQFNPNMSGLVVATDAQAFSPPRYNQTAEQLEVEVAGPHKTINGDNNTGRFEASLPKPLLDQWGVSSPSDLSADYEGETKTVNGQSNQDGSIDVGFDIHYSAGQVNLAASNGDSSSTDDSSTDDSSTDDSSTDDSSTDDSTTTSPSSSTTTDDDDDDDDDDSTSATDDTTTKDSTDEDVTASVSGAESTSITSDGDKTTITLTNASANETVSLDLEGVGLQSNTTENDSTLNETDTEETTNETRPNVSKLDLNLSTESSELGVSVSSHDEAPDGTPEYTGTESNDDEAGADAGVVGYLQIDVSGTSDDEIEDATITFTVPAEKLESAGRAPADVVLSRYHDGEWQTLETKHLGGDRYAAVTPGFSVFAITTENASVSEETQTDQSSEDPAEQTETTTETATATETTTTETATVSSETTHSDTPGFGVPVALAALALVAARVWRD